MAYEASDNQDDIRKALLVSTGLSDQASITELLLFSLGHYDLAKKDNGKAKDGFFRSRDKGVQEYLAKHNITSSDTAKVIKELGGVHDTYVLWCEEKNGGSNNEKKRGGSNNKTGSRSSVVKAVHEACPGLEKGDLVLIQVRVGKSGKFEFVGAQKCTPDNEGGAPSSMPDASAAPSVTRIAPAVRPAAFISGPAGIV